MKIEEFWEQQKAGIDLVWGGVKRGRSCVHMPLTKVRLYDGAEAKVPESVQFIPYRDLMLESTDVSFFYAATIWSRVHHLGTSQLEWCLKNPPWVTWCTRPNIIHSDTLALQAHAVEGACEWLMYWWHRHQDQGLLREAVETIIHHHGGTPISALRWARDNAVGLVKVGDKFVTALQELAPKVKDGVLYGGHLQEVEVKKLTAAGWPHHLRPGRQPHASIICGDLMVYDLPCLKDDRKAIRPKDICDDAGRLLPYSEALAKLRELYNEFEDPEEYKTFVQELEDEVENLGRVFSAWYEDEFGEPKCFSDGQLTVDTCWRLWEGADCASAGKPMEISFKFGFKRYLVLVWADCEYEADDLGAAISIQRLIDGYQDCYGLCWLKYRGLLSDTSGGEVQPFDNLSTGMQKDYLDWCAEAVDMDGWEHGTCNYDGMGHAKEITVSDEICQVLWWRGG